MTLALAGAALIAAPGAAQAQNPLSSIFECDNPNNRQGTGAIVGGLLGGLLGNTVAGDDDETLGTVLGAAVGAAAGSYIGCRTNENTAQQAEEATRVALNQNRATTWSNPNTGVSGRVEIVDTFYRYDDPYDRNPGYRDPRYGAPLPDVRNVSYAPGVNYPSRYNEISARYRTDTRTNVRASPNIRSAVVNQLYAGQQFDAIARVDGNWLLAVENGVAIGYVAEWVVDFETDLPSGYDDRWADRTPPRYGDEYARGEQQLCRTFDQTVRYDRYGAPQTTRYTACQVASGDWMLQNQA